VRRCSRFSRRLPDCKPGILLIGGKLRRHGARLCGLPFSLMRWSRCRNQKHQIRASIQAWRLRRLAWCRRNTAGRPAFSRFPAWLGDDYTDDPLERQRFRGIALRCEAKSGNQWVAERRRLAFRACQVPIARRQRTAATRDTSPDAERKQQEIAQYLALSDGFRGKVTSVKTSDPLRDERTIRKWNTKSPRTSSWDWTKKAGATFPALLPLPGLPESPKKNCLRRKESSLGHHLKLSSVGPCAFPAGVTAQAPPGTSVKRELRNFCFGIFREGKTYIRFVAPN